MLQLLRLDGTPGPCHPYPTEDPHLVAMRMRALRETDFTDMRFKLMLAEPEGKGWTEAQAMEAEKWYRHFLVLAIKYPNFVAVPNKPIDEFWHAHILDTRKYEADCKRIFGHLIHHYPYYGLRGDATERDTSFDDTNALYRAEFGEDCTEMDFGSENKGVECNGEQCHSSGNCNSQRAQGAGCNGGGSGTGCGQRCGRN